ncbi:hypothetical protein [Methanosarcina sp. DH2]|nr:hypothetical protein [Methanosarcina sp. DH2]
MVFVFGLICNSLKYSAFKSLEILLDLSNESVRVLLISQPPGA